MRTAAIMPTLADPGWDRHLPSLFAQTMPADEVIVVVDRALNEAERAMLRSAWPGVRFLFNDRNLGITRSLNVAMAATEADIVFRADDDDESLPTRFARQLDCFERTGADLVATWGEGVAETGPSYAIRCPTEDGEIRAALLRHNVLLHPSLAFRRARVAAIGGYDETFVNAQDYALYLTALRAGYRFAAVPAALVRRHYGPGNITVRRRANQLMYSCAAQVAHHAATGDRAGFLRTVVHYAMLAAIPAWARTARRKLFGLVGRGA
ncbi:MAG TPA: glycosyltransferase [Sphingomonas sp.]|jgi:glycosyltransferase involved in cell wall biosynthesis|uniref:glycosyltransferase n=1 Tax=Sphingomonas sp. TaxID=28214 RepID=UPI002ED7E629